MTSRTTSNSGNRILVIALVVVFAGALAVALMGGDPESDFDLETIAAPEIDGDPVVAAGDAAPQVTAANLLGEGSLDLVTPGEPTMLIFLAHWCPACNAEVPEVVEWLETDPLPDGVTVRAVATAIDPGRANFPPDTWLSVRDWPVETIVDTDGSVQAAYGVTGYPAWVFVDGDGAVVANSGPIPTEQLDEIAAQLAEG